PNGPRFSMGRLGFGSQVSMWLGPPAIHRRVTLFLLAVGRPLRGASARCRRNSGTGGPALPAGPALRELRRPASAKASQSRGWEAGESGSMMVAGGTAVAQAASSIAGEHGQAGGGGAGFLTFHYTLLGGRLPSESAPERGSDRRGFDFALCNSLRSL